MLQVTGLCTLKQTQASFEGTAVLFQRGQSQVTFCPLIPEAVAMT